MEPEDPLASIVALDVKTGAYVWHYQVNPENSHDFNDAMDIELADMMIGGKMQSMLIHAPKNGFFYVLDRETGTLVSAGEFAKQNWAKRIDPGRSRLHHRRCQGDGRRGHLQQQLHHLPRGGYDGVRHGSVRAVERR